MRPDVPLTDREKYLFTAEANAMARLWQLGVTYIQGFHVQAPEAVLLATDVR